jgi:hypothetical protein
VRFGFVRAVVTEAPRNAPPRRASRTHRVVKC